MASANFSLPHVSTGAAGGEVTHNDALNQLDALIHLAVEDFDINTPPGSPSDGKAWKTGAAPTGAWSGKADNIAIYYAGWIFKPIRTGMLVFDKDTGDLYVCTNAGTDTWGTVTVT